MDDSYNLKEIVGIIFLLIANCIIWWKIATHKLDKVNSSTPAGDTQGKIE